MENRVNFRLHLELQLERTPHWLSIFSSTILRQTILKMPVLVSPTADDTEALVDDQVGFKLGKFCGKYRLRLLVGLLIFLVVAGTVFAVAWILTRRMYHELMVACLCVVMTDLS